MPTSRLEAFSDGVLAIIITIMVLELRVPEGHDLHAFTSSVGTGLLTYLLSFVYIGIYWSNHHHMLHVTNRVTGGILWANLHLLFWLSLFPFTTSWTDHSDYARTPLVVYGVNLCAAAIAYFIMQTTIIRTQGPASPLKRAIGKDTKGKLSPVLYIAGIACALGGGIDRPNALTYTCLAFFVAVAVMWLVPDRRIERSIATDETPLVG
jgi:TMEM175 potassium channel family protein